MSANDELFDAAIGHQVDLAAYSNSVVRRMIALLNRTDARLAAELDRVLQQVDAATFNMERLQALLSSVRALLSAAYADAGGELATELQRFTEVELQWLSQTMREVLPVQVSWATVSAEAVYSAALSRPFQGTLLRDALANEGEATARRVRQAIAQGFVEGRTNQQIIRDVIGTRAKGYSDGLLERSRRDVEAIVRTAVMHHAGFAQDRAMEANEDIIKAVRWSAALDTRTSETCRPRDGKLYHPVTHKPIGHSFPWLGGPGRAHWRCRSASVPVLKSWREIGLDIDGEPNASSTRASMDGQIPAETSYGEWLQRQSAARQDEVLGPERAKLLREGRLTLEQMYDQKGRYLTLEALRAKLR